MVAPGPAALAFNALQLPAPMPLVQGAADLRMLGVAFASDRVLFNLWYHTRRLAIGNTNILLLHVTHGDDAVGRSLHMPRRAGPCHCIDTVVTLGIASRSGKYRVACKSNRLLCKLSARNGHSRWQGGKLASRFKLAFNG